MAMDKGLKYYNLDKDLAEMKQEQQNSLCNPDNIKILSQDIEAMFKYNVKTLISCVHCIEIHRNYNQISLKIPFYINNKKYHILKYIFISHTNNITQQVTDALSSADKMITNIKLGGLIQ